MPTLRPSDPLWYKDAVFYQLNVKSFADSNADGIGDFPGLTSKLDHLASLGVDCLWLQPMYPSPFKTTYDISDTRAFTRLRTQGIRDLHDRRPREWVRWNRARAPPT